MSAAPLSQEERERQFATIRTVLENTRKTIEAQPTTSDAKDWDLYGSYSAFVSAVSFLLDELATVQNENEEWSQSFDLYDKSLRKATALWQTETGHPRLFPGNDKIINWFIAERERLTKERAEARAWAEKTVQEMAVNGRVVTCIYCGMEYGEGTPTSQDERLTAHIRTCEKHPMRALETENAHLREGLEKIAHHPNAREDVDYDSPHLRGVQDGAVCAARIATDYLAPPPPQSA